MEITNLPRESLVRIRTVPIDGITTPDAVVSVDGELVMVDANGEFTHSVLLREGTNFIEVVASDFQGSKVSSILTIIYIP